MSYSSLTVERFLVYAPPVVAVERGALFGEWESLVHQIHSAFLVQTEGDSVAFHVKTSLQVA